MSVGARPSAKRRWTWRMTIWDCSEASRKKAKRGLTPTAGRVGRRVFWNCSGLPAITSLATERISGTER